jgi:energy-coupling factor transporter ATP-binding protein EcfA2
MGPNGAGKSTLLLHLNGGLGALDGSVCIDGVPVQRTTLPRVRALVGLVFQDPDDQLFSPTVFDDVAFGPMHMNLPPDEVRRRVAQALDHVDMGGFERRVPHHLNLGQRKRIALATVLSMSPTVLALDKPSAGLDPRAQRLGAPAAILAAHAARVYARSSAGRRRVFARRGTQQRCNRVRRRERTVVE